MNILRKHPSEINTINFIDTPKSCPYENDIVEIIYKNGETQCFTHKTDNPNDLNTPDFDTNEDLVSFYEDLIKNIDLYQQL